MLYMGIRSQWKYNKSHKQLYLSGNEQCPCDYNGLVDSTHRQLVEASLQSQSLGQEAIVRGSSARLLTACTSAGPLLAGCIPVS